MKRPGYLAMIDVYRVMKPISILTHNRCLILLFVSEKKKNLCQKYIARIYKFK